MEAVWKFLIICFWKGDGLETHDEGDRSKYKDGKDRMDFLQVGDERRHHRAESCHGAGEGEGCRPDDGGEELVGVGVDNPPADLGHVLACHGQHHHGPLVGELAQRNSGCGHAEEAAHEVMSHQVPSPAISARTKF